MKKFLLLFFGILLAVFSCQIKDNDPPGDNPTVTPDDGDEDGDEDGDDGDGDIVEIPSVRIEMSAEFVRAMGLGVNIGNTFDSLNSTSIAGETGWGNPQVTRNYIKAIKSHGFKTVRLPVSWADYIGPAPDYTISNTWMNRVERVVNWILAEEMFCILNMHHDGADIANKSWIEDMCLEDEEEAKRKFSAVWKQIVTRFYNASDRLIFEAMNEPQFDKLWPRSSSNQADKEKAYGLLNMLNQTFVDTVRANSAGSKNEQYRYLLVSGYWTDIDNTADPLFKMPTDTLQDRLILSLHYYTPWNFCGGNGTTWGNTNNINELNTKFNTLKINYLDKGIPVIIGEYGVNINTNSGAVNGSPKNNRVDWMLAVTQKCVDLGVCPVLWDTGMRNDNKGMADLQRNGQFAISADLRNMLERVVFPEEEDE